YLPSPRMPVLLQPGIPAADDTAPCAPASPPPSRSTREGRRGWPSRMLNLGVERHWRRLRPSRGPAVLANAPCAPPSPPPSRGARAGTARLHQASPFRFPLRDATASQIFGRAHVARRSAVPVSSSTEATRESVKRSKSAMPPSFNSTRKPLARG